MLNNIHPTERGEVSYKKKKRKKRERPIYTVVEYNFKVLDLHIQRVLCAFL
jgi:hypothetical protein